MVLGQKNLIFSECTAMLIYNGSSYNDTIEGSNDGDTINAFNGQDLVSGEGGDDLF